MATNFKARSETPDSSTARYILPANARTRDQADAVAVVQLIGQGESGEGGLDLLQYGQFHIHMIATFAYTGGTTNPNLDVTLQRKCRPDQLDSEATAWEDIVHVQTATTGEWTARFGLPANADLTTPLRGTGTLSAVSSGHPGVKMRLTDSTTGGDRTGGQVTYSFGILGLRPGQVS